MNSPCLFCGNRLRKLCAASLATVYPDFFGTPVNILSLGNFYRSDNFKYTRFTDQMIRVKFFLIVTPAEISAGV